MSVGTAAHVPIQGPKAALFCAVSYDSRSSDWCRGFTNPLRKLYRQLLPKSRLAREFSSKLANMHSIWHKIMTDVLVRPEC